MRNGIGLGVEERINSLFQPDILLSAQYLATFRNRLQIQPEKKLMLAVLEDAVACFQNYIFARDKKGKLMFREAQEWILERDNDWPFSFENICEALGFNTDYVRQGLLCWKENKLQRAPNLTFIISRRGEKKKCEAQLI